MNDQNFKRIFAAHRIDVADEGFSERLIRRLPERKNMLPQMVMTVFVAIGLALTFAIQGVSPLLEQIDSLIVSISQLQAPSPGAVIAYLSALSLMGIISYSVVQADAG